MLTLPFSVPPSVWMFVPMFASDIYEKILRKANNWAFFSEGWSTPPEGELSKDRILLSVCPQFVHSRHLGGAQKIFVELNCTESTCKWLPSLGNAGNPPGMKVVSLSLILHHGPQHLPTHNVNEIPKKTMGILENACLNSSSVTLKWWLVTASFITDNSTWLTLHLLDESPPLPHSTPF